jgi:curved DNA-binding protein CbpA
MTDPHDVLGVSEDATQEEITAAYHRLVRRYHPDTAENAEPDRFREVVAAYTALRVQRPTPPRRPEPELRAGPVRYHGPPRR